MSLAMLCAILLASAGVFSGLRRWWQVRSLHTSARPASWRSVALIVLPSVSAALLYFALFPPERQAPAGQLTVLTANASNVGSNVSGPVIALPEAPPVAGVERLPDLANALRQRPGVQSLRIVGDGLPARDRESVSGLSLEFESAAAPVGLVEYWQMARITPGAQWTVRGRIQGLPGAGIRLIDPAGKLVSQTAVDATGRFVLNEAARGPGLSEYQLKISDAAGKPFETLTVPIAVSAPVPMRMLSLSGGPNAEVKALRRWAVDAGAVLDSRIALGPGMAFQTENAAITQAGLRETDWLILDERAWDALTSSEKRTVRDAIAGGLGMLLRLTGPLSANASADFAQLGFRIRNENLLQGIRLPEKAGKPIWPGLNRRPVSVQSESAQIVLRDSNDQALAVWRTVGQGRVGIIWLTDSYRLSLAGFPEQHARIWSSLATALARPRIIENAIKPESLLYPDQRAVFCQLENAAQIAAPDGRKTTLVIESLPRRGNCAGFWPTTPGWHYLQNDAMQQPFFVHPVEQGRALYRQDEQQTTRQLATLAAPAKAPARIAVPGPHWPYFLAWLVLTCLLWWLERSKIGMRKA